MNEKMQEDYVATLFAIEKINKFFIESINRLIVDIYDINNRQSIILYKIGAYKKPISVGQFKQYMDYMSNNLSYNLIALERSGYVSISKKPDFDKRIKVLSLTAKGKSFFNLMNKNFSDNLQSLVKDKNWTQEKLSNFLDTLCDMEEFCLGKEHKDIIEMVSRKGK